MCRAVFLEAGRSQSEWQGRAPAPRGHTSCPSRAPGDFLKSLVSLGSELPPAVSASTSRGGPLCLRVFTRSSSHMDTGHVRLGGHPIQHNVFLTNDIWEDNMLKQTTF